MGSVQTMRGQIPYDALGRVLVHEHIITMDIEHMLNYCPDFDEGREIERAVEKLDALKASGIDSIIDLTVLGLGRFLPRIARIAAQTELNIIVATGCYTLNELPMPFRGLPAGGGGAPDPMADLFVDDIVSGVTGVGAKAAVLKCAIDVLGLTPGVERAMRAVARAHVRTGAPITVHTSAETRSGLVAQDVFAEEGVDLRDVIIGHCGDTTDLDYLSALADRGSILGMDRFGIEDPAPLRTRVAVVVEMIRRGYIGSLTLSHDCFCWTGMLTSRRSPYAAHDYLTISNTVIPALLDAGLTRDQVDVMLVDNPRRHFEGAAQRFAARAAPTAATPAA